MDHRQRQRRIGAGAHGQMPVALLGRQRAVRIDRHQRGAAPLGLLGARPEMQVGGDRIAAPDQDQPGVLHVLDVHAEARAIRVAQRRRAGRGADGAVQQRRTQLVEEARGHAFTLHQAHGAGIAVRQDGLRAARRDPAQAGGDGVERLVPRNRCELALTLGANTLHRRQQPVRVVGAFGVAVDLGAEHPLRGRMLRIALHTRGTTALHGDEQGAGVGAVVRTRGTDDLGGHRELRSGAAGGAVFVRAL